MNVCTTSTNLAVHLSPCQGSAAPVPRANCHDHLLNQPRRTFCFPDLCFRRQKPIQSHVLIEHKGHLDEEGKTHTHTLLFSRISSTCFGFRLIRKLRRLSVAWRLRPKLMISHQSPNLLPTRSRTLSSDLHFICLSMLSPHGCPRMRSTRHGPPHIRFRSGALDGPFVCQLQEVTQNSDLAPCSGSDHQTLHVHTVNTTPPVPTTLLH